MKPFSVVRRVEIALAVGSVAVLASACGGQPASQLRQQEKPTVGKANQALPAVVNGVPPLDLAKSALGAAVAYSVSKPVGVQSRGHNASSALRPGSSRRRRDGARVCRCTPRAFHLWCVWQGQCDNGTHFDYDDRDVVGPCLDHGA